MGDANDRVRLKMVNAGEFQPRVIQVLSKVKGLPQSPDELVNSTPCIVADDVPRSVAEKLQGFLEKAGASMQIEEAGAPEEDLFTPDDLPGADDLAASPEGGGDWSLDDDTPFPGADHLDVEEESSSPSDEFGGFSAADASESAAEASEEAEEIFGAEGETAEAEAAAEEAEAPKKGKLAGFLAGLKKPKAEKKPAKPAKTQEIEPESSEEEETPRPKPTLSSLFKKKSRTEEQTPESEAEGEPTPKKALLPAFAGNPLMLALAGFVCGALLAGIVGWFIGSSSAPAPDAPPAPAADSAALQDAQTQNADLQAKVSQQAQEIQALTQQKDALAQEVESLKTQSAAASTPKSIEPSQSPDAGATPDSNALVAAFEEIRSRHASSMESAYDVQKQAKCSQQLLLNGEGAVIYAQVVRKFSTKFTSFDILATNSLITPYAAELKIPFQEELRTGKTEQACNAAQLKPLDAPPHPEFGSYYGYWTIQYLYRGGKWVVKPTVIERNRALYEKAFKVGSPDIAKFALDTALFPEFKK